MSAASANLAGLPCETNAMFTNIEGDWDEVMAVVKWAVDVVAERQGGAGRGAPARPVRS